MKIGTLDIDNPFVLAPMAGFTDACFRQICGVAGAGLLVTEMVSARGLIYGSENTRELLVKGAEPTAVQLFSNEPEIMADCVQLHEIAPFLAIDINMGCPMPKIVNNGMGSALLRDMATASKVITAAKLHTTKPVTVKMRIGWDSENINAVEFARMCEASGADWLCVHGRTRAQMYTGRADWDVISEVKKAVNIPVIGNGDITSAESARHVMSEYGVDGVAIGRGALGNPWLFATLSGKNFDYSPLDVILWHYRLAVDFYGEKRAIPLMRKILSWYLKRAGVPKNVRAEMNTVTDYQQLVKMLENAFAEK